MARVNRPRMLVIVASGSSTAVDPADGSSGAAGGPLATVRPAPAGGPGNGSSSACRRTPGNGASRRLPVDPGTGASAAERFVPRLRLTPGSRNGRRSAGATPWRIGPGAVRRGCRRVSLTEGGGHRQSNCPTGELPGKVVDPDRRQFRGPLESADDAAGAVPSRAGCRPIEPCAAASTIARLPVQGLTLLYESIILMA